METLEIETDKAAMKRIKQAEKEKQEGKGVSLKKLNEELKSL